MSVAKIMVILVIVGAGFALMNSGGPVLADHEFEVPVVT
jgi:hypothetical protein